MMGGQDLKTQMALGACGGTHLRKVIQEKVVQTNSSGVVYRAAPAKLHLP